MNIVKKTMAWLLAVTMLVTSVDYVHAAEAVHESQADVTTEVSQGDSSAVGVSENVTPDVSENNTPEVSENAIPDVSENNTPEVSENAIPDVSENNTPDVSENSTPDVSENSTPSVSENDVPGEGSAEVLATGDGADVSAGDILYSGTENGVTWSITESGLLAIGGRYNSNKTAAMNRGWLNYKKDIKKAVVTAENVKNAYGWFWGCSNMTEIDVSGFDTSNVTDMSRMFSTCDILSSLDLSSFDTSNVTDMSYMFSFCESLSSLDLSSFDTSNVTDMSNMFYDCESLTSQDVSGFDTSNVTDMSSMFSWCESLTSLDVGGFNTSNVTDMSSMFTECESLTSLDVSGFNTSNVTDMSSMFSGCNVSSLDLSSFDTGNVTNMSHMFYGCDILSGLDLSSFDTGNVTDMSRMFMVADLTSLDLSSFDTGKVTDMSNMFYDCVGLIRLDISSFNTANLQNANGMLGYCTALNELKCMPNLLLDIEIPHEMQDVDGNVYDTYLPKNLPEGIWLYAQCDRKGEVSGLEWYLLNSGDLIITGEYDATAAVEGTVLPWHMYADDIKAVTIEAKGVESTAYWFAGCSELNKVNLSQFDTSKVTNMEAMFKNCTRLYNLDVSGLDMSKVVNADDMFLGTNLDSVKTFRNLNISIKLPHYMVEEQEGVYTEYTEFPQGLEKSLLLEVPSFHGTIDGLRWYIFYQTDTLYITGENTNTEIPDEATEYPWKQKTNYPYSYYSKVVIDAKGVISTAHWFEDYTNIKEIDVSNFDVTSLVDTTDMLKGCTSLEKVKTFKNLSVPVALPFTMHDDRAGAYTECPLNVTEDVWIYKQDRAGEIQGIGWVLFEDGTLVIGGSDTSTEASTSTTWPWHTYKDEILKVKIYARNVKSTAYWFLDCTNMTSVDCSEFDTSSVQNMKSMFCGCSGLEILDLSGFNMKSVTAASMMLDGCTGIEMIYTPKNLALDVVLPAEMMDADLNMYTTLPKNNAESIVLDVGSALAFGSYCGMNWVILKDGRLMIAGTYSESLDTDTSWKAYAADIKSVKVTATGVKSTKEWFDGLSKLESVDFSVFDTSKVTDMSAMFRGCSSLKKLNLNGFDTRNVTSMRNMFNKCEALTMVNISGLNTSKVTDMGYLFYGCKSLDSVNLKAWNTAALTDMTAMFTNCSKLSELDLRNFNTENVTMSSHMFRGCSSLTELDLSSFDMIKLTTVDRLLEGCTGIKKIYTPKNLTLDVALPFGLLDAELNMYTTLPKNNAESIVLDAGAVLAFGSYRGMNWVVLKDGRLMIAGTYSEALDTDTSWKAYAADIKSVEVTATGVKSTKEWFDGLSNLESVDFSGFDTSKVTDMSAMFRGCSSLKTLDLNGFNTGSVTKMRNMFNKCEALTTVNISSLNTSKVTDMGYLFYGCTSLESVDLSTWNTASLTDMTAMFTGCAQLSELDLSNFNTKNVTMSSHMFRGCSSLKTLDLSFFDFSNFTAFTRLLDGCTGLLEIHMPANLSVDIEVPKTMYNYLGEPQTDIFPKYQPEAEWYYAVSPVGEGEIHVSKVYPQTYTGKAIKPEIRIYDGANRLLDKKDFTITYKNNTKAASKDAVNAKGKSIAPTIIVKGKGNYTKTETITFDILAKDVADADVTVNELVAVAGKKVQKPVPKLTYNGKKLVNKKDFTVSYPDMSEENPDAYKAPGTYRILVNGKGNFTGTRELTFTITGGTLMSKVKIAKIPNQTYTGSAIEPEIKVTHGKKVLVKGTDYTVSYANNVEIGKATVTVTGMGSYAGSKSATFQITGQSIAKAKVAGIVAKTYNGKAQTQNITVTLKGQEKPLVAGADYEVAYTKNINAGTATMTITGKGSYTGKLKKTFKINAYDLSKDENKLLAGVPEALTVSYEKGGSKPALSLTFDGVDLAVKKDYTLSYANNKKVAGADAAKAPTITVKGKGNFKGSIKIPFSIVAKSLQDAKNPVKINVPDVAYSKTKGKYISKPTLTDSNGKKLVAGTDYEKAVVYTLADGTVLDKKSVVEAGQTVTVTVTGKGNYSGTISATYRITQASFKSAKIKIAPQVYTGKEITLNGEDFTSVKIGKDTLVYGEDFEIVEGSYKNNVKKGTASVTIKGKGNYGGEKTVKFKIVSKELIWFWRLFE